jgi:cytochrome oxidase Cu insertion factor (SCO1/SenC/PrrC family)
VKWRHCLLEHVGGTLAERKEGWTMEMTTLVGRAAPAFTLPASDGAEIALESLRGMPVVLAFFRGTW